MFTLTLTLPLITEESRAALLASIPGLDGVVSIPLIDTAVRASAYAMYKANETIETHEYVSGVENVAQENGTWVVTLKCSGD